MLPMYMGESYETFYGRLQEMSESEQGKMIREAALFVNLSKEEVDALVGFCCDKNGVPYEASNIKNLSPDQLIDVIVAVSQEIIKIKIDLVTDEQKKN